MKRDLNLMRQILLDLEKKGSYTNWLDVDIEQYSPEQMDYHLELLMEAGLIRTRSADRELPRWYPVRLTWEAHEFLDAARDERRWQKVNDLIAQVGDVPFETVRVALLGMVKQEIDGE